MKLDELNLPTHTLHSLLNGGVETVEQLGALGDRVRRLSGIGAVSLWAIKEALGNMSTDAPYAFWLGADA